MCIRFEDEPFLISQLKKLFEIVFRSFHFKYFDFQSTRPPATFGGDVMGGGKGEVLLDAIEE